MSIQAKCTSVVDKNEFDKQILLLLKIVVLIRYFLYESNFFHGDLSILCSGRTVGIVVLQCSYSGA